PRQEPPVFVEPRVEMLELAAEVGWAASVEIGHAVRAVGVAALRIAVEQFECHQRIEEVARAALMQPKVLGERLAFERTAAELREEAELDSAQQGFGFPERIADLKDAVRRGFRRACHDLRWRQLMRICASLTTFFHWSESALRNAANSCDVPVSGSKPIVVRRSLTSGCAMISATRSWSRSMIVVGVPAGATTPVQKLTSWPLMPCSSSVGTSGTAGERLCAATARPR